MRQADVGAGVHMALLRHFAALPHARLVLKPAPYVVEGDAQNAGHNANTSFDQIWAPMWRPGYGPLEFAEGVTLVGQPGVHFAGVHTSMRVVQLGVRFVGLHVTNGMDVTHAGGLPVRVTHDTSFGSLTLVACTCTGQRIRVSELCKLVMTAAYSAAAVPAWSAMLPASWRIMTTSSFFTTASRA